MLNAFTYSAPRSNIGMIAMVTADDGLIHDFLVETDLDMPSSKNVDGRRFRGRRKTTRFGVSQDFRRFGGRVGGDVGNRKRRNETRYDDWMDSLHRARDEARAVRQQIEEGVAEYFGERHRSSVGETPRTKRNHRGNPHSRSSKTNTAPRPDVVTQSRSGSKAEVVRAATARDARRVHISAVTPGPARPRPSNAALRAMLGLPPREVATADA